MQHVCVSVQIYALALPALLYGSENWTTKARDARRITATAMKYMRKTAGYPWTDYKTNKEIAKELNTTPAVERPASWSSGQSF